MMMSLNAVCVRSLAMRHNDGVIDARRTSWCGDFIPDELPVSASPAVIVLTVFITNLEDEAKMESKNVAQSKPLHLDIHITSKELHYQYPRIGHVKLCLSKTRVPYPFFLYILSQQAHFTVFLLCIIV